MITKDWRQKFNDIVVEDKWHNKTQNNLFMTHDFDTWHYIYDKQSLMTHDKGTTYD